MFTLVTSSKPLLARREGGGFGRLLLAKSCLYSLILGADRVRELGLGHTLFERGYIVCIIHLERNGARSGGELTKLLLLLLLWIVDSDVLARVDVTCFYHVDDFLVFCSLFFFVKKKRLQTYKYATI